MIDSFSSPPLKCQSSATSVSLSKAFACSVDTPALHSNCPYNPNNARIDPGDWCLWFLVSLTRYLRQDSEKLTLDGSGGTFLDSLLKSDLASHHVYALVRTEEHAAAVKQLGAAPVIASLGDRAAVMKAVAGHTSQNTVL